MGTSFVQSVVEVPHGSATDRLHVPRIDIVHALTNVGSQPYTIRSVIFVRLGLAGSSSRQVDLQAAFIGVEYSTRDGTKPITATSS